MIIEFSNFKTVFKIFVKNCLNILYIFKHLDVFLIFKLVYINVIYF